MIEHDVASRIAGGIGKDTAMGAYATVNGQRLAPAVARAMNAMNDEFQRSFDLSLLVSSGRRTFAEQKRLFLDRYRPQASGGGPFGDVRVWKGVRYVRVDAGGTVAQPGTSRHEDDHAVDVRDSGGDPGVTANGTRRSNWMRKRSREFGFTTTGFAFGEPWHIDYSGDPWAGAAAVSAMRAGGGRGDGEFPTVTLKHFGRIGDVRGLQKIARLYGADTRVDNSWGPESRKGFRRFLDTNYGGSITRWLHERWGYDGDELLGPSMIAALQRANAANFAEL